MFQTKKKKIINYLESKQSAGIRTVFDVLLGDYLSGNLKSELEAIGFRDIEIHIDWLDDYKGILVVGSYRKYLIEIQIEPSEFSFAYGEDEPEEAETYALLSKDNLYTEIQALFNRLP